MSEHELSPREADRRQEAVLPHDPPPPPGWVDPLEGTSVAEVLDERRPESQGDLGGS